MCDYVIQFVFIYPGFFHVADLFFQIMAVFTIITIQGVSKTTLQLMPLSVNVFVTFTTQ
jgi:hypothetical protein